MFETLAEISRINDMSTIIHAYYTKHILRRYLQAVIALI